MAMTPETLPLQLRAMRAIDVSLLLGVTPRHVVERLAKRPDFPKPVSNRPKVWIAGEIIAWREAQRAGIAQGQGRP